MATVISNRSVKTSGALFIFCLSLLGSCGSKMDRERPKDKAIESVATLDVQFADLDGKTMNLAEQSDKPTVIFWSLFSCHMCRAEIKRYMDRLTDVARSPDAIQLVTLVLGKTVEEARTFRDEMQIPWTVGIDEGGTYFRKYCPKGNTPCTLVFLPNTGIALQKNELVEMDEIFELTGPWYQP